MNFARVAMAIKGVALPITMKFKQYGPTALVVGGVIGLVGAGVVACIKTPEAVDILEEVNDDIESARHAKGAESNAVKLVKAYASGVGRLARHYAVPIGVATVSIFAIFGGHRILVGRNIALGAAYKSLSESYSKYRHRIVDELGAEFDECVYNGIEMKNVEIVEENGKRRAKFERGGCLDDSPAACYTFLFNQENFPKRWQPNREDNLMLFQCAQSYYDDFYKAWGHITEYEVLRYLGATPQTMPDHAGSVGWHMEDAILPDGSSDWVTDGDPYIKIEPIVYTNEYNDPNCPDIWFTLNCQGYIDNLFGQPPQGITRGGRRD